MLAQDQSGGVVGVGESGVGRGGRRVNRETTVRAVVKNKEYKYVDVGLVERYPRQSPLSAQSLASARGVIADSSAHFIAAATGATDRNLPSRHFPCRAYGDPYLFVDRDVRGFARGTRS